MVLDIKIDFDDSAWRQVDSFLSFNTAWDSIMRKQTSKELAEKAEEYFKPLLNVRPQRTGRTKDSIRHTISYEGDGFEVEYYGLLSALYMDQGNFPAGQEMWVPRGNAKEAFPVDSRFGSPIFTPVIHGMGHSTPGAPTNWSDKTAEWLENSEASDILFENMCEFLNRVVVT